MKILAVSLLRMGDVLMHEQIGAELRRRFPEAEIDLLINDAAQSLGPVLNGWNQILVFPRTELQQDLVEENKDVFRSYLRMRKFIQDLRGRKYDRIYNLTHSLFSARFLDLLRPTEIKGIFFDRGRRPVIKSRGLAYFNDLYSQQTRPQFHYLEALAAAVELENCQGPKAPAPRSSGVIGVQPFTSDEKKNWNTNEFHRLVDLVIEEFPDRRIVILGAPFEKEKIEASFRASDRVELAFPKWSELKKRLTEMELLITSDTSVQHLSAQVGTPTLSIFLGSADAWKTAPYLQDCTLIVSEAACAPCEHSLPCPQSSHECERGLTAELVFNVLRDLLLRQLPRFSHPRFSLMRTRISSLGRFQLWKQGDVVMQNWDRAFQQVVWQFYLDRSHQQLVAPFGTAARGLKAEISLQLSEISDGWIRRRMDRAQSHSEFLAEINDRISALGKICVGAISEAWNSEVKKISDMVQSYLLSVGGCDYFHRLMAVTAETNAVAFHSFRQLKMAWSEADELVQIDIKLGRTLREEMREQGVSYVQRTRELSSVSPQAT